MLPKGGNLFSQDRFITGFLDRHFGMFDSAGIRYLCCPGNDDLKIFDRIFDEVCEKHSMAENIAQRKADIGGYEVIGMDLVQDYPFGLKDRCRRDTADFVHPEQWCRAVLSTPAGWCNIPDWKEYAKKLPTLAEELEMLPKPENPKKAIYVIHMPPEGLGLDICLDRRGVGSKAVYEFLKEKQPLLSLHGHIHESPDVTGVWMADIGKTVCIQPGQPYGFAYVVIELPD
ncbi:MAG: phosphoesterase [Thermoplasmata archaeon HGW-Thermoplasmata-1]|nr:MAG: phosphoesterase [Thermoplasmata archaeon HGW-Thermoplasmata-1]